MRRPGDAITRGAGYLPSVDQPVRTLDRRHVMGQRERLVLGTVAVLVCELITIGGTIGASHGQTDSVDLDALAILLLAVPPLTLPLRLRWPLQVLAVTLACVLAYSWIGYPHGPIYLAVGTAYFTVHRRGMRRWAIASLVVGYVGLVWVPALLQTPGDSEVT